MKNRYIEKAIKEDQTKTLEKREETGIRIAFEGPCKSILKCTIE